MTRKAPRMVTPEAVEEVKATKAKYPDMNDELIGRLCDFSHATVHKILAGHYDHKPAKPQEPADGDDLALAVMELSDRVDMLLARTEEQNKLLKAIALGVAVYIDPKGGNTSAPVAEAIRKAVRGES
jgi:hypothetical protein